MFSFLQYLIAFVIARDDAMPAGAAPAPVEVAAIVGAILGFALAMRWLGRWLARRDPGPRAVAGLLATANLARVASLGVFCAVAQPLGGRDLPHVLGLAAVPLVSDLVRLAPFLLLVASARWGLHRAAVRLRLGPPKPAAAVGNELRQALLPLAPILLLAASYDLLARAEPTSVLGAAAGVLQGSDVLMVLFALALVFVALLIVPSVLRVVWRTRPLEAGPLRDRLERYAERVGFRARDFLVWPSGGYMNAAVVGALPAFRYVVLTDGLLETLDPDEIEAVFAHEAGHARRGHILLFFGFTAVLPLALLLPGATVLPGAAALGAVPPILRAALVLVVWIGVVFGWVSRRFEQEADVYGLETVPFRADAGGAAADPSSHPFARALERIAAEAGGIREITGWRHFSIADRVDFVRRYLTEPDVRRRYRRSILVLRSALLVVILGFGLTAAARVPGELGRSVTAWRLQRDPGVQMLGPLGAALNADSDAERAVGLRVAGVLAHRAGDDEAALRWFREAAATDPGGAETLVLYARFLEDSGRPRGADLAWRELAAAPDVPEAIRELAASRTGGPSEP